MKSICVVAVSILLLRSQAFSNPEAAPKSCPEGGIFDATEAFCCPDSCGKCGGRECNRRPGGSSKCCVNDITVSCRYNKLPCVMLDEGPIDSKEYENCPAGSISDKTGEYCCPVICGSCGGKGCSSRPGGSKNCCTESIIKTCDVQYPPCRAVKSTAKKPQGSKTESPSGASLNSDSSESSANVSGVCSNGGIVAAVTMKGGCQVEVCCPASCEECDSSMKCSGPTECCAHKIAEPVKVSDIDVSCRNHDPPCVVPPDNDPCTNNPCQNGARCSYAWQGGSSVTQRCFERINCMCDELDGNYSGNHCEIQCGDGEVPCGAKYMDISTNITEPNDICCKASEECLKVPLNYGSVYSCLPYDRPTSCDPNPCMNGGVCNAASYSNIPLYICNCAKGFDGTYCENAV